MQTIQIENCQPLTLSPAKLLSKMKMKHIKHTAFIKHTYVYMATGYMGEKKPRIKKDYKNYRSRRDLL